jgi:hypothetical protein
MKSSRQPLAPPAKDKEKSMAQSLILLDTDRTKEYIFATGRLAEMRGASALLEELNRVRTRETIQHLCSAGGVVYSNGGSALARVPTDESERIITAVEALYRRETRAASISGAALPYKPGVPFGAQVREVDAMLRLAKDEKPREPHVEVAPWLHICDACGQYPASHVDEEQLVCAACHFKRRRGGRQRSIFWQGEGRTDRPGFLEVAHEIGDHRWRDGQLPWDLDEIGAVSSPKGYVGFLYADGNHMGEVLEGLDSEDQYRVFSDTVDWLTRDVVHQALLGRAQPRRDRGRELAPFEILLMGGDDLMLVTAANLAVSVALDIVRTYQERARNETGHELSLSLGLVLAHAHFPIYAMRDLAKDLLERAKRLGGSALDFAVVTASGSRDLKWLRDEVLTDRSFALEPPEGRRYRLTQRPYRLDDFARLCHHARELYAARFPRSQLQALYEGLFVSGVEASLRVLTVLGRASARHRQKLRAFLDEFSSPLHDVPPWRREDLEVCFRPDDEPQEQCFSAALGDLVELYRFVPALEEGEDQHAGSH